MGFYEAYYDAAGRQDSKLDPEFMSFAGVVATERKWARLERRWNKTLKDFGLPHIHTSALYRGKGEFANWPRDNNRLQRLFDRLAELLADEATYGLHVGAVLKDYWKAYEEEQFIRDVAGAGEHSLAGPYSAYGAICVRGMQEWYELQLKKDPNSKILHFIEKGDLGWGALKNNLSKMFDDEHMPRVEPKLDPFTDSYQVPFQATDFFAWHSRRYWLSQVSGVPVEGTHALRILIKKFPDRRTHSLKELRAIAADHAADPENEGQSR